jgi:hypothetical protein
MIIYNTNIIIKNGYFKPVILLDGSIRTTKFMRKKDIKNSEFKGEGLFIFTA